MSSIQPQSSHGKVLAVDDDEAVLALLLNVLQDAGYEVSTAQDGAEALRMAQSQPLDLVLTDLVMPNRDGIEVIQTIRKQQPNLRIIAISGAFGGNMLRVAEVVVVERRDLRPALVGVNRLRGALDHIADAVEFSGMTARPERMDRMLIALGIVGHARFRDDRIRAARARKPGRF